MVNEGENMKKQRIEYISVVDALVAVTKHLYNYESQYKITSEEFYNNFIKGRLEDSEDYIEWANDYKHYITIRHDIEEQLRNVA